MKNIFPQFKHQIPNPLHIKAQKSHEKVSKQEKVEMYKKYLDMLKLEDQMKYTDDQNNSIQSNMNSFIEQKNIADGFASQLQTLRETKSIQNADNDYI